MSKAINEGGSDCGLSTPGCVLECATSGGVLRIFNRPDSNRSTFASSGSEVLIVDKTKLLFDSLTKLAHTQQQSEQPEFLCRSRCHDCTISSLPTAPSSSLNHSWWCWLARSRVCLGHQSDGSATQRRSRRRARSCARARAASCIVGTHARVARHHFAGLARLDAGARHAVRELAGYCFQCARGAVMNCLQCRGSSRRASSPHCPPLPRLSRARQQPRRRRAAAAAAPASNGAAAARPASVLVCAAAAAAAAAVPPAAASRRCRRR